MNCCSLAPLLDIIDMRTHGLPPCWWVFPIHTHMLMCSKTPVFSLAGTLFRHQCQFWPQPASYHPRTLAWEGLRCTNTGSCFHFGEPQVGDHLLQALHGSVTLCALSLEGDHGATLPGMAAGFGAGGPDIRPVVFSFFCVCVFWHHVRTICK